MYLIQYTSINFIDAEDIYALTVSANCVKFSIRGDDKSVFEVDKNLEVPYHSSTGNFLPLSISVRYWFPKFALERYIFLSPFGLLWYRLDTDFFSGRNGGELGVPDVDCNPNRLATKCRFCP